MQKNADMLATLVSYSIRAHFYRKALIYAESGYTLFKDSSKIAELYVYSLILNEQTEKAIEVLETTEFQTKNMAYLKLKCALLDKSNQQDLPKLTREYFKAV